MITDILELLPYALAISLVGIVIPAIVIALQEISIEGPFGWSSLTFTRRLQPKHWFSKAYRLVSGQDKWATEYHMTSNIIWFLMYFMSFLYIPLFSKLSGNSDWKAFIGSVILALACCQQLMWVEDFIWFLIHPYYGPERHSSEYIPWFQNWKAGIPTTYWIAIIAGILIIIIGALLAENIKIIFIWIESLIILLITLFGVIRPISRKIKRKPLAKFWWNSVEYVIMRRCPYYVEGKEPFSEPQSFFISKDTVKELKANSKILPLERKLGKK